MNLVSRRHVLLAAAPAVGLSSGCSVLYQDDTPAKRLVSLEIVNADDSRAHTFEVILIQNRETIVYWETFTLDPDTFRTVPATWKETESFVLSVQVDDSFHSTAKFPEDAIMTGQCWKFAPIVDDNESLSIPLEVLSECADAPTPGQELRD